MSHHPYKREKIVAKTNFLEGKTSYKMRVKTFPYTFYVLAKSLQLTTGVIDNFPKMFS